MNQAKWIRLGLLVLLVMAGCRNTADEQPNQPDVPPSQAETTGEPEQPPATQEVEEADSIEEADSMDDWLEQIRDGSVPSYHEAPADGAELSFRWGLGYLTYYGSVENVGVDNLIYNALSARVRLATGETTADNLPRNDNNLIQITEGIELVPNTPTENQIGQTPELRQAILDRIVSDQHTLSPDDALASGEIIGVIAIPSPEDVGAKYLVYGQETPGADFVFLGVVMVVDAINRSGASAATFSSDGWDHLPWLGDAGGPFWQQVPAGGSGDPTKTTEGRPGVLFVHEEQYQAVK